MEKELIVTRTTYEAKDGQQVTLDFETIKKYLVQGNAEYVTRQEMMFFMGICKSRGLNPFNKDCYLMKYGKDDNAAIIESIQHRRSRAKDQKDCKGWGAGIIVMREKKVVYTKGLMLPEDELLGGWFKGKPEGWDEPLEHEVNLSGYIKKTKQGEITRFWKKENQPMMIEKVAESQGLEKCWPKEFAHMYTPEVMGEADAFKTTEEIITGAGEEDIIDLAKQFEATIGKLKNVNQDNLNTYLSKSAEHFEMSIEEIKAHAIEDFDGFWKRFEIWEKGQKPKKESTLSPEEQEVRNGFIHIKKPGTLRGTEEILRPEMSGWSKALQTEWLEKWERIMREPYEFPIEKEEVQDPEDKPEERSGPDQVEETEKPDPPIFLNCPETYDDRPEKDKDGRVSIDVCDNVCEKRATCLAYTLYHKNALAGGQE